MAYDTKDEHDKAILNYNEAIRLAPTCAIAYCKRGAAYYGKGEYDKAITDVTEAVRLDPVDASYYRARGSIYAKKGDKSRANKEFERFRRIGLESLLRELDLPPARQQAKAAGIEALEKRIKDQVSRLEYNDEIARGVVTLVGNWNIIALSQGWLLPAREPRRGQVVAAATRDGRTGGQPKKCLPA